VTRVYSRKEEKVAERQPYVQNISWLYDLRTRGLLNLDPPYQRRSVWPEKYREDFIDTVLLDYPAPAIFLFETVSESGVSKYDVVDGKQRLSAVFDFIGNGFAVAAKCPVEAVRGIYFESFDKERRIRFFKYKFSVEVLTVNDEAVLDNIFDRLNRNVAKLTPQELRHAKFGGEFITAAESLSSWLDERLEKKLPKITGASRRQMKDVEITATLLLYLEEGPKSYSTASLDAAFASRDESWDSGTRLEDEFRTTIDLISKVSHHSAGAFIPDSRFKNQADFYSLFAGLASLKRAGSLPKIDEIAKRLRAFNDTLDGESLPQGAAQYLEAARSASNDVGPRKLRIAVMRDVIQGNPVSKSYDGASRG
jgi:hypothetical protein